MSHFPGTEDFGGTDFPINGGVDITMKVKKEDSIASTETVESLKSHACMPPLAIDSIKEILKDPAPTKKLLPIEYDARKKLPIGTGVLDYFPAALVAVAEVSYLGNEQHNPGEELHWARGKSMDQFNTMIRHAMERGSFDTDGVRHSAKAAWRALALLQLELEAAGAPMARGAR